MMDSSKIEDLLLKMIEDIAYIKSKLESIEAQNLGARLDAIEAQNKEHDHAIKALEHRANEMEKYTRDGMTNSKKQMTSVFISIGMAIFSAVLSVIMNLI